MRPLLFSKSIKNLDQKSIRVQHISSLELMERAVVAFVAWFKRRYEPSNSLVIFCGLGNNGADGLLASVLLKKAGYSVAVYTLDGDNKSPEYKVQYQTALDEGLSIQFIDFQNLDRIPKAAIFIDALFGAGLSRPLSGDLKKLVLWMNRREEICVSIDMPSGMPVDTYFVGPFVKADVVATFQTPKFSFFLPEYADAISYEVIDIGLEIDAIEPADCIAQLIEKSDVQNWITPRKITAHKGNFGHALLVAGAKGKMGAAVLSGKAILRSGAALLSCSVPKNTDLVMHKALPEAMLILDKNDDCLSESPDLNNYAAIGLGPGLGTQPETAQAVAEIIGTADKPMVIDADGINLVAKNRELLKQLPKESILTPHPKEFERLVGPFSNSMQRLELQKKLSVDFGIYVLVKGAFSMMTSPEGAVYINSTGNPGMATAGSGDVLTGILTGLLAKGMPPKEALLSGVYLHGLAGDIAAEKLGEEAMIASDLIDCLGAAFLRLSKEE